MTGMHRPRVSIYEWLSKIAALSLSVTVIKVHMRNMTFIRGIHRAWVPNYENKGQRYQPLPCVLSWKRAPFSLGGDNFEQ